MGPEWTEEQYRKLSIVIMQGLSSKSYLASMQQFVDLFAGLGGFHVALNKLGHDCVFASEIETFLRNHYEKNFELYPEGDITKINIKDHSGKSNERSEQSNFRGVGLSEMIYSIENNILNS